MNNFAAISPTELVPIFAVLAGMLVAFYALIKFILNQAEKDRAADRAERQQLAKAISAMADPDINGNTRIADGIERQANESKERNGHLGEMITEQSKQTAKLTEMAVAKVIEGVQNITTQNVIKQNVKQSTVKDETIENEVVKNKGDV